MALPKGEIAAIAGAFGWLVIFGGLLGLSGMSSSTIELPTGPAAEETSESNPQGWVSTTIECLVTLYQDCSRVTKTKFFTAIEDFTGFALSFTTFMFQLITFQIPEIPTWLNAMIILPPGAVLAYIGLNVIARRPTS